MDFFVGVNMVNKIISLFFGLVLITACGKLAGLSGTTSSSTGTYIYVASGTSYPGNGMVASTASNTVVRYNTDGTFDRVVTDYTLSPGDTPVSIVNYDSATLLVLVENASGRRIDRVQKDGTGRATFLTNSTALNAQMRALVPTFDGGYLVSKSSAIEKFSSAAARILMGANPYVYAPAAPCATSTTLISSVAQGPNDVILYSHAAATPNNIIGMISANGYSVAANCITAKAAPSVNHYPTNILLLPNNNILVSYENATGPVHEIDSYPVTATSIGAATVAYSNASVLQGVTTMTSMPDGTILVAAMASTFNAIYHFSYNTSTQALSLISNTPLIPVSIYTKSVSSMLVTN
jgi:hypothetical protein